MSAAPDSAPHPSHRLILRLLGLCWKYRWGSLVVLFQQVLLVGLGLATLGLTGLGIDLLRHARLGSGPPPAWPFGISPPASWTPWQVVLVIAGGILLSAVLSGLLRYVAAVSSGLLVQRIVVDLRTTVYEKLQHLSFRFYDARQSGAIINRVAGDVQAVRMFVDGVMIQILTVVLSLAVYLAYMLQVHVWLTLACIATTPLLWVGAVIFSRIVKPEYRRSSELIDELVLLVSENFQGMPVIKGFAQEGAEISKFRAGNRTLRDQKKLIFRILTLFQPGMGLLTQLNMLILLGYGGWLVVQGEVRLGEGLFVFANLLQQFASQVGQVTNVANTIQTSLTGAGRVFEVLDTPTEISDRAGAIEVKRARGAISFENVSFSYDHLARSPVADRRSVEAAGEETDDPPSAAAGEPRRNGRPRQDIVLEGVSFEIQPGECVAIVGATGAGKSTLLSLIPRFYDPADGRILLDGTDLKDLKLQSLRRQIGIVFQESFLFSNTVAANIAFGHPEASDEQIIRAAQLAQADEFIIELPAGYNTVIGEYGCDLSGGQRQRLALARALLLDPAILLLDDATSAVDPETEGEILSAMDRAMEGRTTFLTAHRLSTLKRADRIIVLEHGRITQIGTHRDLLDQPGHYRDAARMQMSVAGG